MTGKQATAIDVKVLAIVRNRKNWLKYKELLRTDFFRSTPTKTVYQTLCSMHTKFKHKHPTLKQIWLYLENYIDEDDYRMYKKLLIKVGKQDMKDLDIVDHTIKKFASESMLLTEFNTAINQISAGQEVDIAELHARLGKVASIESKKADPDFEYFSEVEARHDVKEEPPRLPTGISKELDHSISGGVAAGELAFFLAPTGRGKTLALVNIGANALRQGKKVLHMTFEIRARRVAKRYDTCLTDMTTHELMENPGHLRQELDKIKAMGGNLIIRDFTYSHCGIGQLHGIMEGYAEKDEKPDILIIDYADLMVPPEKHRDSRHELNRLYEELRIVAGEFDIPVWSASQTNRAALSKRVVTMSDVAEAWGKTFVADLIVALCQTDDEKEDKEMRMFVAKSRMGATNPIVTVHCDPDRMILRAGKEIDRSDIWSRPRMEQLRRQASGDNNKSDIRDRPRKHVQRRSKKRSHT